MLVLLRILAAALSLYPNESSLLVHQWGFGSLGVSVLVAGFAAVSFWMLGQLVSKLSHSAALGGGDVLLLAACCLFLETGHLSTYVLLIALFGIVLALAVHKEEQNLPICTSIGLALLAAAGSVSMGWAGLSRCADLFVALIRPLGSSAHRENKNLSVFAIFLRLGTPFRL